MLDRFAQVEPTVLIAVDGYRFGGREHDRREAIAELQAGLPSLRGDDRLALACDPDRALPASRACWTASQACAPGASRSSPRSTFDHPLWILFSSGTTGLPKGIVQGHGGILLEHLKSLGLCMDLRPGDRYFFYSSTSWMAWNYLVGGLLHGTTIVLYDGSPGLPATRPRAGASPRSHRRDRARDGLGLRCRLRSKAGLSPGRTGPRRAAHGDPDRLAAAAGAAGGGCTSSSGRRCGSTPICRRHRRLHGVLRRQPAAARRIGGESRAAGWGSAPTPSTRTDGAGRRAVGEFVRDRADAVDAVGLWDDADGERYRETYFDVFPGVWRQGDWATISPRGSVADPRPLGRDAQPRRRADGLGRDLRGRSSGCRGRRLPRRRGRAARRRVLDAAVRRPADGASSTTGCASGSARRSAPQLSPRHVPDEIVAAPAIPRTLTGKKLEVPVKRILQGMPWSSRGRGVGRPSRGVSIGSRGSRSAVAAAVSGGGRRSTFASVSRGCGSLARATGPRCC